jgi:hypothetical protein
VFDISEPCQQFVQNVEPFPVERLPPHALASPAIPVRRVALIVELPVFWTVFSESFSALNRFVSRMIGLFLDERSKSCFEG